jgi:hypothetical protein
MPELSGNARPLVPFALVPALLVLLAPLCGRRARTAFAALLAIVAAGFVIDMLVLDHTHEHTLAVPNVFPRGPAAEPHRWTIESVTAPAWHWHVWIAFMLLLPAVILFVRRDRAPGAPRPAPFAAGVFLYYLVLRLGLEESAASEAVVWAAGSTFALLLMLPFVGWYCGRRGHGFARFVGALLSMAFLQRLPLVVLGFVATTRHLVTHLDTHVVEDIAFRGIGELRLDGDFERWLYPTAIPHLSLWVVLTLVAGLLLGTPAFFLARRKPAGPASAPSPTSA